MPYRLRSVCSVLTLLVTALLTGCGDSASSSSHHLPGWLMDETAVRSAAAANGKPILILATADWCGPCQALKKTTLSDPTIAGELQQRFNLLLLDVTDSDSPGIPTAQKLGVEGIPTLVVQKSDGTELGRTVGFSSPEGFRAWLKSLPS